MQFNWLHHNSTLTESQYYTECMYIYIYIVYINTYQWGWCNGFFGRPLFFYSLTCSSWTCVPIASEGQLIWSELLPFCYQEALPASLCISLYFSYFFLPPNLSGWEVLYTSLPFKKRQEKETGLLLQRDSASHYFILSQEKVFSIHLNIFGSFLIVTCTWFPQCLLENLC